MNILVIDDQGIIREGISILIRVMNDSYTVTPCRDLNEARERIESARPDVIFLDVSMKGEGDAAGLHFLDELKERECDSRIIMLSNHDDWPTVSQAISSGAVGFITKSDDPSAMRQAIDMVLQGGIFISAEVKDRRGERPMKESTVSPLPTIRTIERQDLETLGFRLAPKWYEVLWHLSNGVKGYKAVARKMGISEGTAEGYARDSYRVFGVGGKDGFLVMLSQKGWRLSPPPELGR